MSSLKSRLTLVLLFVFIIIMILTVSSLVMVYQLGVGPQPLAQPATATENPFEGFTPLFDSPVEQLKNLLASKDSTNVNKLLSQFDATSKIIERRIDGMEAAAPR